MNIIDAAYHTVHDYPGGATALAPRLGIKSPAVLNSKVNPNTDTHHITLVEAIKIMAITNDYRILQSMNAHLGKVAIDLPQIPECRDTALTDLVLSFGMQGGDVYTLFKTMMADGRITRGEAVDLSKVIHKLHEILAELNAQVHKCIEE
ncbi:MULTISPECIES: phage regulatory CII family protein [Acinetobacter]|nr:MULTISPECIES: phage regulatory CII family protein [Acinetobacter]MCA4788965.1 phage regulatory CII family protein [Acinetobacter towneri]MCO8059159.1 phage regulatory CII family protein [Acinetobacter towneri]MCO8064901.1 phage regulatory CII family protein [Acinetobacter towneri]HRO77143.1 phage regulatory CII family protein [Acinetobacter towneri]